MKPIDMLQCSECSDALKEYIDKTPELTTGHIEHLEAFALFMELRRLRKAKVQPQLAFPAGIRTFPDPHTVVC